MPKYLPVPPTPSSAPPAAAVFAVPGTLFPHLLLDEVMPALSGSEWALLCVVVRQTLGWHDPTTGGRKASDWLSHRQLKARTGRGSDAVCSAVDSLVRRGLIEVKDDAGRALPTPAARRRASRLFYTLSPSLLARLQAPRHPEAPQAEHSEKPKASAPPAGETHTGTLPAIRESRFRKPETTKENGTKDRRSNFGKTESKPPKPRPPLKAVRAEDEGCGCLRPLAPPPSPEPASVPPAQPDPELLPFLRFYGERLGQYPSGQGEPGAVGAEDQARLKEALKRHGPRRLEQMAETFLGIESALLHYEGYGIGAFLGVLPTLAVLRPKRTAPPDPQVLGAEPEAAAPAPRRGE